MHKKLFRKAKHTYHAGMIRKNVSSERCEYYIVEDYESKKEHMVTIQKTEYGPKIICECTMQSLHGDKQLLCSHILTVIFKKYFETKL